MKRSLGKVSEINPLFLIFLLNWIVILEGHAIILIKKFKILVKFIFLAHWPKLMTCMWQK